MSRDDVSRDEACTMYNTVFKKLMDIGDIVGVKGFVNPHEYGKISVHAKELVMLSSLRPLPVVKEKDGKVFDAFTDPELRPSTLLGFNREPAGEGCVYQAYENDQRHPSVLYEMGCLEVETLCCRLYREELRPVRLSRIIMHWIFVLFACANELSETFDRGRL